MDAKAVRRAGLDYWKHVDLVEHADEQSFWDWVGERRIHLFSAKGRLGRHTDCQYQRGDVLLFGRETVGLPPELVEARGGYCIPMRTDGPIRSLNLGNAVAVCAYEAVRQLNPDWS